MSILLRKRRPLERRVELTNTGSKTESVLLCGQVSTAGRAGSLSARSLESRTTG